ncbi:MlaD family protein [Candidatus Methylomirabilis sp.]|uniref:MlaD family protein n=1 Tax=Candidatus Methylomirabilis sp. TaxID=2032687 RepID=UPI003076461B
MSERERWMRLRVGIFILGLIGLFIGFVLTIGSQSRIFERRYTLHAFFSNIEGLNVGAPIRLAGTSIGSVHDITFSKDLASKKIRVTMSLDARLQDRVREDSIASIGTIGLVGDKVLELTVGSPDKPILPPGATIASVDPPDYAKLLQKGDQIVNNVVKISDALGQLVGGGTGAEARQDLAESIASFNRIMEEIEQGTGLLHAIVYEKRSGNILKELSEVTTALQQLSHLMKEFQHQKGLAHILFADPRAESVMADLEQTSKNLKLVSSRLAQGEGTLGALIDDPTLYEDLSSLLRGANRSRILRSLIQSTRQSGASAEPQ